MSFDKLITHSSLNAATDEWCPVTGIYFIYFLIVLLLLYRLQIRVAKLEHSEGERREKKFREMSARYGPLNACAVKEE